MRHLTQNAWTLKSLQYYILSVLVTIVTATWLFGQLPDNMPSFNVANVSVFNADSGLPVACTFDGIYDSEGRLWVNSCFGIDEHRSIDFFQFDGNSVFTAPGHDLSGTSPGQSYLQGSLDSGKLFGSVRGSRKYFYFDPETLQTEVYKLGNPNDIILYNAQSGPDETVILTATGESWVIYLDKGGDLQEVGRVPQYLKNISEHSWYFSESYAFDGENLWFYDYVVGRDVASSTFLVRFNIRNGDHRRFTIGDLVDSEEVEPFTTMFRSIKATRTGDVYLFIGGLHKHFKYEPSGDTFHALELYPKWTAPQILISYFALLIEADESGNVLFLYKNERSEYVGYLMDKNGQFYDYSEVLGEIVTAIPAGQSSIKHIIGKDFRKGGTAFTDGGLAIYELQFNQSIQSLFKSYATRSICEVDSSNLLVVREAGFGVNLVEYRMDGMSVATTLPAEEDEARTTPLTSAYLFSDIKEAPDGTYWFRTELIKSIGRYRSGRILSDIQVDVNFQRFEFVDNDRAVLASNNRICVYHMTSGELEIIADSTKFTGQKVYQIKMLGNDQCVIATLNGLWHVNLSSGECNHISEEYPDDRFMCLEVDKNRLIWAGTFGSGIFITKASGEVVDIIDASKGLSNNTVVGLMMDDDGFMWASTYNGLNVISPEGEILARLYKSDGLAANEFNRGSFTKGKSGRMYFGSVSGISIIDPAELRPQVLAKDTTRIVLSKIFATGKDGKREEFDWSYLITDSEIKLPADDRHIDIEFGLTSLIRQEDHHYEYRLDGTNSLSQRWNSIGNNRSLSLDGLPPGRYDLHIRGSDHRGTISLNEIVIPIHSAAFFYQQAWFYLLLAFIAMVIIALWIWRERNKRRELELIVAQRTSKIREDKATIEQQAQELQALDELKSRFFTNISHEFRTPLTVIDGMARKAKEDPERWASTSSDTVRRNARRLLNLVNQILDLRKLEAGKLKPRLVKGDVIAYTGYIAGSFQSLAEAHNIEMHVDLKPASLEMDHDREMWQRILSNLLSNAIKYNQPGGEVWLSTGISPQQEDKLIIEVRDTGIGISGEELNHIFDLFYQADTGQGQQASGTGVGLALTKELVELLGGGIAVKSQVGSGTLFTIELPITKNAPAIEFDSADPDTIPQYDTEVSGVMASTEDTSLPSVLIIEDSRDVMQYISACLEGKYALSFAPNGRDGLEAAIEEVPDLIISDVMMPYMNGYELCDAVKNDVRTSHIPVVLLTAKADIESRLDGLKKGADVYLAKPFDERELIINIDNLLEVRRTLQSRYAGGSIAPTDIIGQSLEDSFMRDLTNAVHEHISDDTFSVPDLCNALGMSRTQLHNKIKSLTGRSTSHYVRLIRLNEAKRLIISRPDLNFSQIAFEVGFASLQYFSRMFNEEFGITPSAYRKVSEAGG